MAAMVRYAEGARTRLPMRLRVHLVAARYGTTPAAVREWPADDFLDAMSFLGVTK
jgi:hypothetical protein